MAKIYFIAPNQQMVEHAKRVIDRKGLRDITAVQVHTTQLMQVADKALVDGADIFLARGLQASMLRNRYDTPVVEIRMTGQEMGLLVTKAKALCGREHPRVGIIGSHNMFCDMRSFPQLYGVEIAEYFSPGSYADGTYDLDAATDRAIADGVDVVIGGEMVCSRAKAKKFPAVFLESTEESVAEGLRMAASVAYTFDMERKNSAEMRTLIDYSFNGIIMINRDACVVRMNHLAEKLLQTDEKKVYMTHVSHLIPDLDEELLRRVFRGEESVSNLIRISNSLVVANVAPVKTGTAVDSVIISFYERGRVEEMEEEIRRGLYHQNSAALYTFENVVGESREFLEIVEQAKICAKFNVPVLIIGEPGTEKEMLAQCMFNASVLNNGAFISLNCDSVPPEDLDTTLFGSQLGARSIQKGALDMAEGGVLFIDEIQKLSLPTQYKLYKFIHKHTILRTGNSRPLPANVRIIAASSTNLVPLVRQGKFREDLFYALNVLNLNIPPLRFRKQDVLCWINKYIEGMGQRYSRYIRITSSAAKLLADYEWDGNLPQIRSFCERVAILAPKRMVDEVFVAEQLAHAYPVIRRNKDDKIVIYKDPKAVRLAELLEECGGNRTLMAEKMGISKSTLWRYMKKYQISG